MELSVADVRWVQVRVGKLPSPGRYFAGGSAQNCLRQLLGLLQQRKH